MTRSLLLLSVTALLLPACQAGDKSGDNIAEANAAAAVTAGTETKIPWFDQRTLRHQHGALGGVVQLTDVTWPWMFEQHLQGAAFKPGDALSIPLRVLAEEVLRQQQISQRCRNLPDARLQPWVPAGELGLQPGLSYSPWHIPRTRGSRR